MGQVAIIEGFLDSQGIGESVVRVNVSNAALWKLRAETGQESPVIRGNVVVERHGLYGDDIEFIPVDTD